MLSNSKEYSSVSTCVSGIRAAGNAFTTALVDGSGVVYATTTVTVTGSTYALKPISVTASGLAPGAYYVVLSFLKGSGSNESFMMLRDWSLRVRELVPTTEAVVNSSSFLGQEGYRFGWNGMEKDDEMKGVGNHYTTAWRQYDPRHGRWFSLDPAMAKYPGWSPYSFSFNNPIWWNDPEGDDPDPLYNLRQKRSSRKYGRKLSRMKRRDEAFKNMSDEDQDEVMRDKYAKRSWFTPKADGQLTESATNWYGTSRADELYRINVGMKVPYENVINEGDWVADTESNIDQMEFPADQYNDGILTFSQNSDARANDRLIVYNQYGEKLGDASLSGRLSKRSVQIPIGTTKIRIISERNTKNNTLGNRASDVMHIGYQYKTNGTRTEGMKMPRTRWASSRSDSRRMD